MFSCSCDKKNKNNYYNKITNLLIGVANVGKSSFFNRITWQNNNVSNIDKTTVDLKYGKSIYDKSIIFCDLPGVYNLTPNTEEEKIVIKTILDSNYSKIVNIISLNSLKRDLFLTIDLLETQQLNNVVINMVDKNIDLYNQKKFKLINKLGVNVSFISCLKNIGIKSCINDIFNLNIKKEFKLNYGNETETIINELINIINQSNDILNQNIDARFLAIQFLLDNWYIIDFFKQKNLFEKLNNFIHTNNVDLLKIKKEILETRKNFIETVLKILDFDQHLTYLKKIDEKNNKFNKYFFNKYLSIPIFILTIVLIYYLSFGPYAGGTLNELISGGFEQLQIIINNAIVNSSHNQWVADFVSDGILGGIFTTLSFLPNIVIIVFLMSILEQIGILSRLSVIADKKLQKFGLSGRSIITMITGIGCSIPAILMTKNSQSKKEKILLNLIIPFISCSARLVVFNWIASALVGVKFAWLVSIALTSFSILFALIVSLYFSNALFRTTTPFFLTEIPNLKFPNFFIIFKKIGFELFDLLKKVGITIFIANIILFLLNRISPVAGLIQDVNSINGFDFNFQSASFLQYIAYGFKYLFYPIGLGEDWRLSMSLISAIPAKEMAAANIEILFSSSENFHTSINMLNLPIASSISFLLFFALYVPCLSTIFVIKKEIGLRWMFIKILISLWFSYMLCFFTYSIIGLFEQNIKNINYVSSAQNIFILTSYSLIIFIFISLFIYNKKFIKNKNDYKKYKKIQITYSLLFLFFFIISIINIIFLYLY